MNLNKQKALPFISILVVIVSLFVIVFIKMEVRKQGYMVYKLSKNLKKITDKNRLASMKLAKIIRPEKVRGVVLTQLDSQYAPYGQIIQMTEKGVALPTR